MEVSQILLAAQSGDAATRQAAEAQIEAAKANNLPALMQTMATELANEAAPDPTTRQLAGLVLKNCVQAKSYMAQAALTQRWQQQTAELKGQIKQLVLTSLASPAPQARQTAPQVLAAIAMIELPDDGWPELVPLLVAEFQKGSDPVKQSTLEALGYICEQIEPSVLEAHSNSILTIVVQGMRKEQPNADVRQAGTRALINALSFVKRNFDNDHERNYIMQTVCETTLREQTVDGRQQIERLETRVGAFECLVAIAELYYDKLGAYMTALFELTKGEIEKSITAEGEEEVGQQAVEFWVTVCDEELDLIEEEQEAQEEGGAAAVAALERKCQHYAKHAAPTLLPLLLRGLTKKADVDEDDDDDEWTLAKSAATCLERMARTVDDAVVPPVLQFMQVGVQSQDWRAREAAILAFGSILEGPSDEAIGNYVSQGMDYFIGAMRDASVAVRDTAAWTIGRICDHQMERIQPQHWKAMMHTPAAGEDPATRGVLWSGLEDHPRVAANVCLALHNLAEHCEDQRDRPSNPLSTQFIAIAQALLACTERADAATQNLRTSAYEALNTTVTNSAEDTKDAILHLLPIIITRLEATFSLQIVSNDDRESQIELQGLLCGTLQVATQKLAEKAAPHCDRMMAVFLQLFAAGKNTTVHEEALMAVGAVANATEGEFLKYMPHFQQFLSLGLANVEEYQVCAVAIGVIGDVCRALEAKVLPYCDEIVNLLLQNVANPALNRNVKPPILCAFGDIALAIAGAFEKYLAVTMQMLVQAAGTQIDMNEPELVDYLNKLREGIFEAYTGVVQGLRADSKAAAFMPHVPGVLGLLQQVATSINTDADPGEELVRAAVGVVGDLSSSLGPQFKQMARQSPVKEHIKAIFKACEGDKSADGVRQWAYSMLHSH